MLTKKKKKKKKKKPSLYKRKGLAEELPVN